MIDLEELYFDWLLHQLDEDGVPEGAAYLCSLLHACEFHRRVGRDINRARDGANLRKEFLEEFGVGKFRPDDVENLLDEECSWLEMLVALSRALDFYYEGGVYGRFAELISNMELGNVARFNPNRTPTQRRVEERLVAIACADIDSNRIAPNGHGGLFPLKKAGHPDQREVEIWDQQAAYFRERLEGVLWT